MNTRKKITEHLKEEYNPEAIILHGSRARGRAGENSDWDIFLLLEEEEDVTPEEYQGEQLDIESVESPVDKDEIIDRFGTQLIVTDILYDPENKAAKLLKKAEERYEKGPQISEQKIKNRRNFLLRYLNRLKDRKNKDGAFFWYASIFYGKAMQYWHEILQDEWSQPTYVSLEDIEQRDPKYFEWLRIFYQDVSKEKKIEVAEKIFDILFDQ